MRRLKEETGSSTLTIILLLIIVLILGGLFYLRANNLIQVDGNPNNSQTKQQNSYNNQNQTERNPQVDVKGAVENMEQMQE